MISPQRDPGSVHVSRPLPLTATKKKQPSLSVSVESGKGKHRRTRSAEARVDPDLYPLSSSLRPAKPPVRKSAPAAPTSHYQLRRERSRSITGTDASISADSSAEALVNALSALHQRRVRPHSGSTIPREPAIPVASRPDSLATHDSLCDSLYEPAFVIPSSTKIRRDKMARVCKLLGEEVPVELVFPSATPSSHDYPASRAIKQDIGDDWSVIDIRRSSMVAPSDPPSYADSEAEKLLPPLPSDALAPLPSKPKLTVNTDTTLQALPKWTSYRAGGRSLEPIAEMSPRSSCSSRASYASGASFSSTTTSSSYRFTSSGCSDPAASPASPAPANAESDNVAVASPTQDLHMSYGFSGRREFSIYLPFQRRARGSAGYAPVLGSDESQEFEVVKTMVDLRV